MYVSLFGAHVCPVWMFQWPNVDLPRIAAWWNHASPTIPLKSLLQEGFTICPKTIQGKGKDTFFKLENCWSLLFHFTIKWFVHPNSVEHHDQNCVSLCILICSPRILLHFQWSKMGYRAQGYSFSVQLFFLRPIRIRNPPTPQTVIKRVIHSLSTFAHCLLHIIRSSGQYVAPC